MQKEELYISYITKDVSVSGTSTSDAEFKLIDAGALFLTGATPISKGDLITNTSNNRTAKVVTADSDTQLTLNKDIFPVGSSPVNYKINKLINERIELLKSLNPNITFNIADIAKPDQRKTDYSKTIKLPASKKIRKVFENIFEVNIDLQTFNPNLKTNVLYLVDGEINLDGYLQLKQVNTLDNDDVEFQCVIIGSTANFIKELGDKELDDPTMLWTNLNHDYTKAIQQASWTPTLGSGYVYPMIDYGFSTNFSGEKFDVIELFPATFVKEYIDRIFDAAGFTYQSTFFDTPFFKSLIIPCNHKEFKYNNLAVNERIFTSNLITYISPFVQDKLLSSSTTDTLLISDFEPVTMTFETDPNNLFNPTNGEFTCVDAGYYDFYFEVDLTASFEPLEFTTGNPSAVITKCISLIVGTLGLIHTDNAGNPIGGIANSGIKSTTPFYISYDGLIPAGATVTTTGTALTDNDYISEATNFDTITGVTVLQTGVCDFTLSLLSPIGTETPRTESSQPNRYICTISNLYMNVGDKIRPHIASKIYANRDEILPYSSLPTLFSSPPLFNGVVSPNDPHTGEITLHLNNGIFRNRVANNTYVEGNNINMNDSIPKKIKQKDFFMSIIKMFNLYVEPDKNNENNLLIEPRDDFYNDVINDWSEKLDVSKELEFLPMGALDSKEYLFSYKQDKDYYNELYETSWNEIYGQREEEIENDFLSNQYKTNIIFSPTPSVGQLYHDRVIPTIKKYDPEKGNIRTESNIRILQWGGLKNNLITWQHKSLLVANTNETQYPYAGHLDDPFNPVNDINFGLTNEVYFDDTYYNITWTNNNLYNRFYKKFIEEITDINSKIVKGWFYLRPSDIRNLSFKQIYYFDGAYFRLNKIENYNPSNPITKCEFLKLKEANPFVPDTTTATGGTEKLGTETVPYFERGEARLIDNNFVANRNIDIKGLNNYVDPFTKNIDINGNDNLVLNGSENVFIRGNGNSIEDAKNVTLINTNNVRVVNDGVTYVNNQLIGVGSVEQIDTSITADESIITYLVDTSSGAVTITFPSDATIGKIWNVKVLDNTNECILATAGTETIDGYTDIKIEQVNTTISIQWDGTNYKII